MSRQTGDEFVAGRHGRVCVSSKEAAQMLAIGTDRLWDLTRAGVIETVPHLTTEKRFVYAIAELERVAATGVKAVDQAAPVGRRLAAVSQGGTR